MTNFGRALLASSIAATSTSAHVFRATQEVEGTSPLTIDSGSKNLRLSDDGPTMTVPEYSSDQCGDWLVGVLAADSDGSGGLSEDEFLDFLKDIDDPPHVTEFFNKQSDSYLALPWLFKVAHKSLACRCIGLGLGSNCCTGENAEISFLGLRDDPDERQALTQAQLSIAAEYRADMCNSVAAVFEEVIPVPVMASPVTPAPVTPAPVTPAPVTPAPVTPPTPVTTPTPTPNPTTEPTPNPTTEPTPNPTPNPTTEPEPAPCGPGTEKLCPPEYEIGLDIIGSVLDYSAFDYSEIFSRRLAIPEYYNAQEIMTNEGENDILSHAIKGFGILANQLMMTLPEAGEDGGGSRSLRGVRRHLQVAELKPVQVSDIACPDGLQYAPFQTFCIKFVFEFRSDPESESLMRSLITELTDSINEGTLYEVIKANYRNTLIKGMGSPGKGVDYKTNTSPNLATTLTNSSVPADEDEGGLSPASLIIIIICVICIPIAGLAMYSRHKKIEDEKRMQSLAEYNAKKDLEASNQAARELPGDDEQSMNSNGSFVDVHDDSDKSTPRSAAGSSLAAMGAAGAAATMPRSAVQTDDKAEIRRSVKILVDETKAPKSADQLLATYSGREEELLSHLNNMKAKQSKSNDIRSLVEKTNAPKGADELLAAYAGREDELLSHLKKMESKQDQKAEIVSLVAATSPGKSAEELSAAYEGREEELIKNLKKMQTGQMSASQLDLNKASIRNLVDETAPGKTADELLSTYEGREDELLKNLTKMKSKQEMKSSQRDSISSIVDEIKPGKSAEELLATYDGREGELLKNLEKMKSKEELNSSKQASVRSLVDDTNPGKSAEELLALYDGREDELIKNLEKMKDKQGRASQKDEQRNSIVALVDETAPGKTAEELLTLYHGNEDQLIKNLTKMKAKQEKATELNAIKQQSVRALVDETNPGKSAEELLAMYDGKEDALIKNLTKMKTTQENKQEDTLKSSKQASVRALVDETSPGKSAEELLAMYEGKEDDLIKNLTKMKMKQEKTAELKASKRESVRALVDETNPGKSAEELLAMYDDKEDDLIKNLEKMKAKQEKSAVKEAELKAAKRVRVSTLVDETMPGKSAEELLALYDGKEDQLIKNLEKMNSKKLVKDKANKQQSVRQLVDETNPGKSAEELLAMYDGKEDDLIKNLTKMKTKQDKQTDKVDEAKAAKRASITALVAETSPGKSAEELLAAYDGKEDELIKNLTKMKTKQDAKIKKQKHAEIISLVESTNPGKSAEELIAAYDGKEDELIKNLTKMKSKKDLKASGKKSVTIAPDATGNGSDKDARRRMVEALVAETNPGKSADDLLKAYEGREEELVTHLKKLKKSKRNVV